MRARVGGGWVGVVAATCCYAAGGAVLAWSSLITSLISRLVSCVVGYLKHTSAAVDAGIGFVGQIGLMGACGGGASASTVARGSSARSISISAVASAGSGVISTGSSPIPGSVVCTAVVCACELDKTTTYSKQTYDKLTSVTVHAGIRLVGQVGVVRPSVGGGAGLVVMAAHGVLDFVQDVRHVEYFSASKM